MDVEAFYDLYLYAIPDNNKLIKIPHLTRSKADTYGIYWVSMNKLLHDYMLVTEDSTPWSEPAPSIDVKTPEWILTEYERLNEA